MADNQMVKIVFDFDLGNVPASAKKLSQYLKDNNLDLKFTKQSVDAATASLKQFATAQTAAGNSAAQAGNQLKKSNMQWTNLALVIQDLPYGFRGIQNNLPALIGGFAGMSGAIYLAGSAIIAFFTAYNMGLFESISTTNKFEAANKKAIESVSQEATKVALLVAQYKDSNTSALERKEIIKELNSINPQYFGNLDKEKTSVNALNDSYLAYIGNLGNVIKAKKLEEELTKNIEQRLKFETEAGIALLKSGYRNPELINQQNAALKKYNGMLQKEADLAERITNLSKVQVTVKTGGGKGGKTPEQLAKDAEEALLKAQNVQVQNYIDTLDNRNKEIVKSELQLQEDIFTLSKAGFTNYESALLANSARIDDINSKYDEIEYKRNQKSINDNIQFENKLAKDLDRIDKEKLKQEQDNYNTSLSYLKQYYNNKRDFATNNKEELKNIAIEEQATLDSLFIGGAINYEDYLKLSADSTAKFIKLTDDITKNAFDNMLKIGNGLMSALGPSLDLLLEKGENIGDVLSNAFQSILKQLAKVIISAAIAVALISILFPTKLAEAGGGSKLFGGLFLQGMGFGGNLFGAGAKTTEEPKKAANGGIFGGPAYRMIGEYPGAQSNPEIVAPLDKLKNLIGGSGGGTLEARISGNDLLILMNKAQRNNNLSF